MNKVNYMMIKLLMFVLGIGLAVSATAWSMPGIFVFKSEGCFPVTPSFAHQLFTAIDANSHFVTISLGLILVFLVILVIASKQTKQGMPEGDISDQLDMQDTP